MKVMKVKELSIRPSIRISGFERVRLCLELIDSMSISFT